jgi:cobalt-zinc-cadmium efflux system outer membrane protein
VRVLLLPLLLLAAPSWAQPVPGAISIEALAQEVVARNPERAFLAQQISLAQTGVAAAGRLADPEISVDFGERRTDNPLTGQRLGDGPAFAVSIVQPIEFNGRIPLRRAIAEGQVQLARLGLAQFDATLAARARTLGYRLFAAAEKADAARNVASRMRNLAEVLLAREAAGPAPRLEAAVLEAAAITAERNAANADSDYNALLYQLNGLRGVALASRLRILRPTAAVPALPPVDRLLDAAEAGNFELAALKAQLQQQGLGVALARKSRAGQLAIGPYFSRDRGDVLDHVVGVRASTTVPLWNRQAGEVSAAQSREAQGQAALLAARRRIMAEVQTQAAALEARRSALAKWPADAPRRFAEAAAAADASYRLGAVPITTYVQMQTGYLDALAAVLDTRAATFEAAAQLQVLTGGGDGPAPDAP